ncbi:hypothetical protein [Nocardioides ferulae]|uniref:hypothetical protein n=1 Tax=Nocardioides ferulae TaxID=2340821 RepID=UPI000F891958|nr:hypothetical protein [Nocardioides ferulae]
MGESRRTDWRQRHGIGAALVRAVLARAEEAGESLVALVGEPAYGDYFQVKTFADVAAKGVFRFAAPFHRF